MGPKEINAPQSVRPRRLHIWLVCIALTLATFAIYSQVLECEFVTWDDPAYVYDNPHIAQGVTMPSLKWAFTSGYAANWHPLTWISHMLDIELFGLERGPGENVLHGPGGHHLISLLLHLANSLLLLWLLYRMTGAFWPSALTAALFAIHPLRVESVAWASERKDVLSGLFFMLTLLAYHAYAQRPTIGRYVLVFIALALGLMAKPMLVTVPFLLLLLDLWPLRRRELPGPSTLPPNPTPNPNRILGLGLRLRSGSRARFLILEKIPLIALVIASCLVTMHVQKAGGAVAALAEIPWDWRLVNVPVAYATYLLKTLWPGHLAYIYPHPVDIFSVNLGDLILPAISATLCLGLVSIAVFCMPRRRHYLLVGWLWFLGMLLPVIGMVQVGRQAWADRYAYLPLVGIYVMISWSLAHWAHHRPALRRGIIAAVFAVLLALLPLTWRQVGVWRNSRSLFEHAIAVTKNSHEAHTNLGAFIADTERPLDAVIHYQRALQIHPAYPEAHYGWGAAIQNGGYFAEAIPHHLEALRIRPDYAEAHCNLGLCIMELGRPREAIGRYREALRIKPDYAEAHNNLGNALQFTGHPLQALGHYEQAVKLNPIDADAHNNWANVLQSLGRLDEAAVHYQQALRIKPDSAEIYCNLGAVQMAMGRLDEAIKHFKRALELKPGFALAQNNLRRAQELLREENSKSE
jgi:tetratricopeptide (TPR) repeat protein